MEIESYTFGNITIDGTSYTKDVVLVGDRVQSPWWRSKGGHVFDSADFEEILKNPPEIVVLGTGAYGLVRVTAGLMETFRQTGTRVLAEPTADAVPQYNRLSAEGHNVAAAFHLTC